MRRIIAIIFALICCNIVLAAQTIRLVKIDLPDHSEVYKLGKLDITVIDAGKNFAKVLVNDEEIADLKRAGYRIEILIEDYQEYKNAIFQRRVDYQLMAAHSFLVKAINNVNSCRFNHP